MTAVTSRQYHISSTPAPMNKFDDGLQRLLTADEAAVAWLTHYGT